MKRHLLLFITLSSLFFMTNAQVQTEILLGGFEGDTVENVWTFWAKPGTISDAAICTHADSVYSGTQSVKARFNGQFTQFDILVKPSTDYVITARALGGSINSKFKLTIWEEDLDSKGVQLASNFQSLSDTAWKFIQSQFTTTEVSDTVMIALTNPRNEVFYAYYDDLVIMEGKADFKAPLVPDTCFAVMIDDDSVRISWPSSIDSIDIETQDVYQYRILRDGETIALTEDTTYLDETVAIYTTYLYQVSAIDFMGNESDTTNFHSVLTVPYGVKVEETKVSGFNMYPNPTSDFITLTNLPNQSSLELYSITGEIVMQKEVNQPTIKISLMDLPKGIYLMKVNNKTGSISKTIKLIKE